MRHQCAKIMYTEPKIVNLSTLEVRSYVTFYFDGSRRREYNGSCIGLKIFPNFAKTITEKNSLLELLRIEILKALTLGKYEPGVTPVMEKKEPTTTHSVLKSALDRKLSSKYSDTYKRDLKYIFKHFTEFLTKAELQNPIEKIPMSRIDEFLSRYSSSNTYYMHKRTDLGVLFSAAGRILNIQLQKVGSTEVRTPKAVLNEVYTLDQLRDLLEYLKEVSPNLYLCCLLTYGTWLRPHIEIRQLKKNHFKKEYTEIHLHGSENKGGKVRIVYVPDYIREILEKTLSDLSNDDNIFSRTPKPFTPDYFKTAWNRLKFTMVNKGLLLPNQTIYSFRHTAAIQEYRRKKDIYLLQKLLGHSSINVTQKYLRGLGEVDLEEMKNAAPRLY